MIPTLILFGLVAGRWWRLTLVAAALGWPVVLLAGDVMEPGPGLLGASLIAVVNTGAGVLVHQVLFRRAASRWGIRDDATHG